jgi:hypothetical protein
VDSRKNRNFQMSDSKKDDKSTERRIIVEAKPIILQTEKKQIAQEEDALEEGIDEVGIQADDEDNDQIETERAINPAEKR